MVLYERLGRNIDNGLIGYWRLDDFMGSASPTAKDLSLFRDGTLNGPIAFIGRRGYSKTAMYFDGIDDYINLNSTSILPSGTTKFTISAWIFTTRVNVDQCIIGNIRFIGTSGFKYSINASGKMYFSFYDTVGTLKIKTDTGTALSANVSYHVAVNFDGTTIQFYTNGVLSSSQTDLGNGILSENTAHNVRIGHRQGADLLEFFKGSIQEVQVYNRNLNTNEIKEIYLSKDR